MIDPTFQILRLPGPLDEAGFVYGKACRELLTERLTPYLADMGRINRVGPDELRAQALRWAARLPERYQEQMSAMADGARVGFGAVASFLYADIAAPGVAAAAGPAAAERLTLTQADAEICSAVHAGPATDHVPAAEMPEAGPAEGEAGGEAGCSGLIFNGSFATGPDAWVARNCDWYLATLRRGTAAVIHHAPHRIPSMAVGLMGDIDADTGINAERLWLHMHTLRATDEPRAGVSCISWLFWMREALETCASLDDVERFIDRTDRDRGVMLLAVDGKRNRSAVYECARGAWRRLDPSPAEDAGHLIATNHHRHKHPPEDQPRAGRPGSTVSRFTRLRRILRRHPPEHLPDDLVDVLADPEVEMRDAPELRTIYSAVAHPAAGAVWFASGDAPAASRGVWRRLPALA
jgi:hypothetical protein